MPDKNPFSDMKRGKEEEYFRKKERELIEKLKQRTSAEQARQQLAEASGIGDQGILQALHELGYTRDTVSLLHLVPLVYVAWAEGSVSNAEMTLIVEAARLRGVNRGSAAHSQLEDWLKNRPSFEFFEKTLRVIGDLVGSLPSDEQKTARQDLLTYSERVAGASGGILGLGSKVSDEERAVLAEIGRALGPGRADAVREALRKR
jgi:hypothetical protein